jgi:hypothetical protein
MRENLGQIEKRFTDVFHRDMTSEEQRCLCVSDDRQAAAKTDRGSAHTSFRPPANDKEEPFFLNSVLLIVERYVPLRGH